MKEERMPWSAFSPRFNMTPEQLEERIRDDISKVVGNSEGSFDTEITKNQIAALVEDALNKHVVKSDSYLVRVVQRIEESQRNGKPSLVFIDNKGILEERVFQDTNLRAQYLENNENSLIAFIPTGVF